MTGSKAPTENLEHGASLDADPSVSVNECQAMRYLAADGYTYREIQLVMEVGSWAVRDHLSGECDCPDVDAPVTADPLVGDELRDARYDADLTQVALADEIDVSHATVSKWERKDIEQHPRHAHALRQFFDQQTETGADPR